MKFGNKLLAKCTRHPRWSLKFPSRVWCQSRKPKLLEMAFWLWSMVTVRWWNHLAASLLPPSSQTMGHRLIQERSRGSLLLFLHLWWSSFPTATASPTCPTPFFHAKRFSHPPRPPCSPGRGEQAGPQHQQLIVGHQQALHGGVQKRCCSSNLISGIIAPSVLLQITFLSTASIFSCETLIRKFKKSWMPRKHLAAIFTFDVLHFLPFPINTSLRWTFPKSNRWEVIYLPFSYYLPSSANTNAYDDICKQFFQRNNCSLLKTFPTQVI